MARKFMFLLFCLFAVVGLSMTACEVDGDGDAETSGTTNTTTDTSGSTSGGTDTTVVAANYYFVRVVDRSTNITGSNPGADLDAISITKKSTGERNYVTRVEEYLPVNEADIAAASFVPENIVGEPEAFGIPFNPANAGPDKDCDLADANFVALGGVGGSIIVSFGDAHVENGDVVTVYEIGGCNGEGKTDPIRVEASVASKVDGVWELLFESDIGPVMSGSRDNLPVVPK